MLILDTKVLRGPNYWSNYRQKLIVLKLDILHYENLPTNLLEGFTDRLLALIPSLADHYCSPGVKGGFVQRLKEGTWLGHVVEHIALELQYLAGMDCTFGRTRASNKENIYYVLFSYEVESAGLYAGEIAVKIVQCLTNVIPYTDLDKDIEYLRYLYEKESYGPSTQAILTEADRRNIPYQRLSEESLIVMGQGCHQKMISATVTSETSIIGVDMASDKDLTKKVLGSAYIPVPQGMMVKNLKELHDGIKKLTFPIVIKPADGNHGRGVITNIDNVEKAEEAYKLARKISHNIVVEHFIKGLDYRFLVVNYQVVAVARRKPAFIMGDGLSTIQQLITRTNQDPKRGNDHENVLTKISIDEVTLAILESNQLTLESILPKDQELLLKFTANISTGGTATDVTDLIHPYNKAMAERIARLLHLDVCGIDIIAENIEAPITQQNGAVIEVNAAPGLRMHLDPTEGKPRNIGKSIMEMLFPLNKPARIPITAVTGTNGKTMTVRLIAHFAIQAGYQVGFTTTDGIYINNDQIYKGDCSGPISAKTILRDPLINFAVLECARGGILRSGLGFDKCNVSIVTNITEDHLGLGDIETLDELKRVKGVVPRSTFKDGFAILNADDDLVYSLSEELNCNIALFSMDHHNPRIQEHCEKGGLACYLKDNIIIVRYNDVTRQVGNIMEIPITFSGTATNMIRNILPSVLAAIIYNMDVMNIAEWLKNFSANMDNLPGRMNLFDFGTFKVLVDYAHNAGAFIELQKYLQKVNATRKIGIVGSPGDRRAEDIINIGYYSAQMFDEIIIRHDEDGRGRINQEITDLIKEGISKFNQSHPVKVISDEQKALETVLKNIKPGTFITYFPEDVFAALHYLKELQDMNFKKVKVV